MTPQPGIPPIGSLLKDWRTRRRLSQLDLALEAEISQRHLSFIESGRAAPSREMVLRLADHLDMPLRERNALLVSAGFAPVFQERRLDDPTLGAARAAIDLILNGHEPYPALAIDRHWTLVAANKAALALLAGVAPKLLEPPVNVLRVSLHPDGLGRRTVNYVEWRRHIVERLKRQHRVTADARYLSLIDEISGYAGSSAESRAEAKVEPKDASGSEPPTDAVLVPFKLRTDAGILSFVSTTTVFGTPVEITLSELMLEAFYPADPATADAMRRLASMS